MQLISSLTDIPRYLD